MGRKGDRLTGETAAVADGLVARLAPVGNVAAKRMFGGTGVFESGTMFAIVDAAGDLYLRADDVNRPAFEEAGCERHGKMPYWAVPEHVVASDVELCAWGADAAAAARRGAK